MLLTYTCAIYYRNELTHSGLFKTKNTHPPCVNFRGDSWSLPPFNRSTELPIKIDLSTFYFVPKHKKEMKISYKILKDSGKCDSYWIVELKNSFQRGLIFSFAFIYFVGVWRIPVRIFYQTNFSLHIRMFQRTNSKHKQRSDVKYSTMLRCR